MRKILLSLFVVLGSSPVFAAGNFGLGFMIGVPTAVVGQYWLDNSIAYDGGISFFDSNYLLFYVDRQWHFPGAWKSARDPFLSTLSPYVGVGPVIALSQTSRSANSGLLGTSSGSIGIGARVPLGVEWRGQKPDLGVYAEFVPGIVIVPTTSLLLEVGLGIRYYF